MKASKYGSLIATTIILYCAKTSIINLETALDCFSGMNYMHDYCVQTILWFKCLTFYSNSKNTFNFGRNYFFLTPLLDIQINHNNSTAMEKPPETNQRHRGENIIQHFV